MGVRECERARRAGRERLDARAQAVAEPPEPAAADLGVAARLRQVLERLERVFLGAEHAHRGAADDRSPAGPAAGQREREGLAPQGEQDPLGGQGALQGDADAYEHDGRRRRVDGEGGINPPAANVRRLRPCTF